MRYLYSFMSFHKPYQFLLLAGLQLGGLGFLFWATGTMLPVVIDTLIKGMTGWTTWGIVYSWVVQLGCVLVSISLRRFLLPVVLASIKDFPVFYLRILWYLLGLGGCAVLWRLFQELAAATSAFGYFVMGEWVLIITQFYLLVSMAAPVCSVEGYRFIFKGIDVTVPRQIKHNHSTALVKTTPSRPVAKGYPGWVWPVLWFLFWVLLRWMGCKE